MAIDYSFLLEDDEVESPAVKIKSGSKMDYSFLLEDDEVSEPSSFGTTRSWGEPTLKEKALRVLPDIGTGFASNLSAIPYNVGSSMKSYFNYVADKFAREYPGMVELELKKQKEYFTPEELNRTQEWRRRFYGKLAKHTKALKMHVPDEQAQRFATKFGSGLASIGKGFIPGLIAVEVWGSSFDQARNQGKTDDQAASYAGTQALAQELSERLGSFALTKIFKNSGTILTRAGKSFLSEGTQEGTQEAMAIAIEKAYGVKDGSPKFKRIIEAFGIGGLTGATVSLAASPFTADTSKNLKIPDAYSELELKPLPNGKKYNLDFLLEDTDIQEKTKDLPKIDEKHYTPEESIIRKSFFEPESTKEDSLTAEELIEEEKPPLVSEKIKKNISELKAYANKKRADKSKQKQITKIQEQKKAKENIIFTKKEKRGIREEIKANIENNPISILKSKVKGKKVFISNEDYSDWKPVIDKIGSRFFTRTKSSPSLKISDIGAEIGSELFNKPFSEKGLFEFLDKAEIPVNLKEETKRVVEETESSLSEDNKKRFIEATKMVEELPNDELITLSKNEELLEGLSIDKDIMDLVFQKEQLKRGVNLELSEEIKEITKEALRVKDDRFKQLYKKINVLTGYKKISKDIVVNERTGLKEQIKYGKQIAGQVLTNFKNEQKKIEALRIELKTYVKENLKMKDRGKFINKISLIKTKEDLVDAMNRVESVAKETSEKEFKLAESTKKKKYVDIINNIIASTKVKKRKGKLTPEIQDYFEGLRSVNKLDHDNAKKLLDTRLAGNAMASDTKSKLENIILDLKINKDQMSSEQVKNTLNNILYFKLKGRFLNNKKKISYDQDIAEKKAVILDIILGDKKRDKKGDQVKAETTVDGDELLAKKIKSLGKSYFGWDDLTDVLSYKDKKSKPNESELSKILDVFDAESNEKTGRSKAIDEFTNSYMRIFGIKKKKDLYKSLKKDDNSGFFVKGKLNLSRANARKIYAEYHDESLRSSFEKQGINIFLIEDIYKKLSEQDKEWVKYSFNLYKKIRIPFNDVFSDITGLNLADIPFYSPIQREGFNAQEVPNFMEDYYSRVGIMPSAGMARVSNTLKIKQQSDIKALIKHIDEIEHYKAYAHKIREINAIIKDPKVSGAIKQEYGSKFLKEINSFVDDFTRGGLDPTKKIAFLDNLRKNAMTSMLMGKPNQMLKQATSIFAYCDKMPSHKFVQGIFSFFRHPIKNTITLMESDWFADRAKNKNFVREVKEAATSKEYLDFANKPNLKNTFLFFSKYGDLMPITLGGWSYYNYEKKRVGHKAALRKFGKLSNRTQVSGDLSQMSMWQRAGSYARLPTSFLSTQNQYFREMMSAVRNRAAGRITTRELAKTIFIYQFLLPTLFQLIGNFGRWDSDDQLRAVLFAPVSGLFVFSSIAETAIRTIQKAPTYANRIVAFNIFEELILALKAIDMEDILLEDVLKASKHTSIAIGSGLGWGVKEAINKYDAIRDLLDGDYVKGFGKLGGWSEWAITKGEEDFDKVKKRTSSRPSRPSRPGRSH